jgi:hypothetical protein
VCSLIASSQSINLLRSCTKFTISTAISKVQNKCTKTTIRKLKTKKFAQKTTKKLSFSKLMMKIIPFTFISFNLAMTHLNIKPSAMKSQKRKLGIMMSIYGRLSATVSPDMKLSVVVSPDMNPCDMMKVTRTYMFTITPNT